jgi:hypothetical protein
VKDEHLYFVRACYGISPAESFNDAAAAHSLAAAPVCAVRHSEAIAVFLHAHTRSSLDVFFPMLTWTRSAALFNLCRPENHFPSLADSSSSRCESGFRFVVSTSWSETRIESCFYSETG